MHKPTPTQLELFKSAVQTDDPKRTHPHSIFDKLIFRERNVIFGICIVVTFIIAYSLGIEKGKRIDIVKSITTSPKSKSKIIRKEEKIDIRTKDTAEDKKFEPRGYTVQVASFKTKSSAEKEKEFLQEKGFEAYVLPKKKYIIVCVGTFENKDTAKINQKKLRRLYDDCLIRKL